MPNQVRNTTPNAPGETTPSVDKDRNVQNGNGQPKPKDKPGEDVPLQIDPAQEKPELSPLVLAQLDPDAGFNGA